MCIFYKNVILYESLTACWNHCLISVLTQSCPILCDPMGCSPPGSSVLGDSPGKNTGVGCHALLQWIFPTQGLNLGLLHCRQILSFLSHKGSPRILEWVPYPFSRGSSRPRNPALQVDTLPTELRGKPTFTYNWSHLKIRFAALQLDETKCQ